MRTKLVLVAMAMVFFQGGRAETEAEAVAKLIKDIQDTITTVREGMPADYLETAAEEIANDAKQIISDAGVKVTQDEAKIVFDQIAEVLLSGAKDIKNPLKFEAHAMEGAFRILKALADKLTEILQSGSTDNLYETLLATKIAAVAVMDAVKDINEMIKIEEEAGQDETVETQVARRSWCVGWSRRRSQEELERDINKKEWCVGWHKRNVAQREPKAKREWCVGWSKRTAQEGETEEDINKRKWCVGWPDRRHVRNANEAKKREWCVGWSKRAEADVDKRKWCVGWPDRRTLVV